jgi:hypothetical protein
MSTNLNFCFLLGEGYILIITDPRTLLLTAGNRRANFSWTVGAE